MRNLAGQTDCDVHIRSELQRCGIEIVEGAPNGAEVNARLTGRLGPFTFTRAWYYWVAYGPVPLTVAREMYGHPVGRTDIRIAGHCGGPPPEHPWVKHYDADGLELVHDPDGRQLAECLKLAERHASMRAELRRLRFVPDAAAAAARSVVETYHIDTELGLYLFVEALKRAGLDGTNGAPPT